MPEPMNAAARCPICGAAIPADAPVTGGNPACPACLLGAGVPTGGRVADVPAVAEVAAAFPDLEILGLLGRGGMGVVWKARQKGLDRLVALKVLPKDVAQVPGFAERFQREARALARLTHPNIVGVHEFGERGGIFFLVLEYVDGTNVRQAMREGRIAAATALRIVPQICDALQYAHEHGVVHRDIKPENVLLDREGRVKVTDFGLAKILGSDGDRPELTVTGQVMGTLHYMAPEQFEKPTTVDHRADIYSLGVVFYEMLTGELPLGRFPPPSQKFHLDVRLDDVVLRSLEKAPERRWQHAAEVKTEVGTIEATPRAAAVRAPAVPRRTSRLALASAASSVAALLPTIAAAMAGRGAPTALLVPTGALVLFGLVAGIVAWVQIARSGGALRGIGFAMAGALVPLLVACAGLPVAMLLTRRAETAQRRDAALRVREQSEESARQAEIDRGRLAELAGVSYIGHRGPGTPGSVALDGLRAVPDRSPAAIVRLYCREDREETFRFIPGLPGNLEPRSDLGLPWLVRDWPADRLARLFVTTQETRDKLQIPRDGNLWRVTAVEGDDAYTFDVVVENGEPKFRATPVVVTSKSAGPPK